MPGLVFYASAILAVIAAFLVVTRRNPVHGAICLITFLVLIAAQFLVLRAPFLAVVQVFVYAGAIMVLFVFVIMLLNLTPEELREQVSSARRILAGVFCVLLFVLLAGAVARSDMVRKASEPDLIAIGAPAEAAPTQFARSGEIEQVGESLFGTHVFVFEFTSILILVAIMGTIYLTKKRKALPPSGEGTAAADAAPTVTGSGAAPMKGDERRT